MDIFESFPRIETERYSLRAITRDDAGALFTVFSDPAVMEFWSRGPYKTVDEVRALIDQINEGYCRRAAIEWGIAPQGDDKLIGKCGFHRWLKEHFRAEIGYGIAPSHWGRGVMREVLPAVLEVGFRDMNLHSVEAQVDSRNVRSAKTLERLGFVEEGHFKENFVVEGVFTDTLVFSLLRAHRG